jgi:hypothetical protein
VLQVVSLNNELFAARAEAMAAEEAVLWELSGRLMGCLEDVETVSVLLLCYVTFVLYLQLRWESRLLSSCSCSWTGGVLGVAY